MAFSPPLSTERRSEAGTLLTSTAGVVRTPPVCAPSSTGPRTPASNPLTSPRETRLSTRSRSCVSGSKSFPPAWLSRSRAVEVSLRASASDADTLLWTRPAEIWRITRKPTEPTTTAQSTTMAVTTRVRSERRQNDGRLRHGRRPGRPPASGVDGGLIGRSRLVADPSHGDHDRGVLRVDLDLGPQPLDVDVDQPGVGGVAVPPDLLEQDLARVLGQADEQVELQRGQPDLDAVAGDRVAGDVDGEVPDVEVLRRRNLEAPYPCPDAGHELLGLERLRHVVVGPGLQADDDVDGVALGGEHHDRDARLRADLPAHVDAVAAG